METYLILTDLDSASVEANAQKAREYLSRFGFTEDTSSEYKQTMETARLHFAEFLRAGMQEELLALMSRPYQWLRLAGTILIRGDTYGLELFTYPLNETKSAVSIAFPSTLYDAIYSFEPSYESKIDLRVIRDLLALFVTMATGFSAAAFALRQLTAVEELLTPVTAKDILDWLIVPTRELATHWKFLLVGIQSGMVDRQQVARVRPAERISESGSGFLIYDGMA